MISKMDSSNQRMNERCKNVKKINNKESVEVMSYF